MELVLNVSDDVARKIRGLSVLTGKTALEITEDIGGHIDEVLTQEIVQSVKGCDTIPSSTSTLIPSEIVKDLSPASFSEINREDEDKGDEEVETALDSLAMITEEEAKDLNEELPATFFEAEGEVEEEIMSTKDKSGEEATYDDSLMADIQAMAEDDDYIGASDSGLVSEDPALQSASSPSKAAVSDLKEFPNDVGENGIDVLPADFGINSISSDNKCAVDFFVKAISGEQGDKSQRNSLNRKPIKRFV